MIVTESQICWTSPRMWLDSTTVTPSRGELAHEVAHLADAARVEAVGGLVEDQQIGGLEQGGRDGEALLHAERVRLDAVFRPIAQADGLQHLVDASARDVAGGGEEVERAAAGKVAEELRALHDRADPADDDGSACGTCCPRTASCR